MQISGIPDDFDQQMVEDCCVLSREKEKPVQISLAYKRPGWKGYLPLYVLWCPVCSHGTVTHPAGMGRITCDLCRNSQKVWTPQRTRRLKESLFPFLGIMLMLLVVYVVLYHLVLQ